MLIAGGLEWCGQAREVLLFGEMHRPVLL